jgi:GT2 family glycosyltransferase
MNKKVAVVILNYNGEKLLPKFFPSVVEHSKYIAEIVFADNCSTDQSISWVQTHYPEVRIVKNDKNHGFAQGYNEVLKQVSASYYVLLNSDVEVTPNWIEPILAMMDADEKIAAVQPCIRSFNAPNSFEYAGAAGGFIDFLGYPFCRGRIFESLEIDEGQYSQSCEIFWASGAAMFIRSTLYHEAGGLDKDFFAHMEEIDLCWRLKNMGYKIMVEPKSVVYHLGGGTLHESNAHKTYLNFRNSLITLRKNLPLYRSFSIIFIRHILDFVQWLRFVAAGRFKHAWAINRAHYDFLITQSTWYHKRQKLIKIFKRRNTVGFYHRSIVFDYFVRKKKKYSALEQRYFD